MYNDRKFRTTIVREQTKYIRKGEMMSSISIFDVMGPNMIGPSSSHTAGALRIALLARNLAKGEVKSAKFTLYGSFARTYQGHGTDRALVGGILGYRTDDERIRNSFEYAKEAGISYEFVENFTNKDVHPNTVDIELTCEDGHVITMQGVSIGGGNAVIKKLNGVDIDMNGASPTVIVKQWDRKGVLAYITKVLSDADLNIGALRLYREGKGKAAYAIAELDGRVSDDILERLEQYPDNIVTTYIPAL